MSELVKKYNKAIPRYTSYPTVPHWTESAPDPKKWLFHVNEAYYQQEEKGISLYIHLPFCESLCTYCGCNKRITKNHSLENPYITALSAEWELYVEAIGEKPVIKNLHLGGGTPTFFAPKTLETLLTGILEKAEIAKDHAFSFEGHPNNTKYEHLKTLAKLGFNRVSYGIQDFNPVVQKAIHRMQPIENVENVVKWSRELGYDSINFDLIYGLPFQTAETLADTIEKVKDFKPERIALYSYAHVPWKSKSQRGYDESHLPNPELKLNMYWQAKSQLNAMGYVNIGMDHFAMPDDELSLAKEDGYLNRNFMGYTTDKNELMIGLGCSSISSTGLAFAQNEKVVEKYQDSIMEGVLPLITGHYLTDHEVEIASLMKKISCLGKASFLSSVLLTHLFENVTEELKSMEEDGLLVLGNYSLTVTEKGMLFVRNICSLFDPNIQNKASDKPQFSQSI
ncbi:oxygen-independent coproporphyrinogen III oxidase [Marivirga sp. S37H4]|uniref:Coproporphyrinogen-III oxidase n=1 Tax=Marivirga aurantiaca TaxID=2802615 RepID=A0A934X0V8_9BACT|nr:oxygen-independent coproporphyrinogen III oxidase [Marivirga aurantiaca]